MDESINKLPFETYKSLYELGEYPTIRAYHGAPYFEKTNGEYIFKNKFPIKRLDDGFLGGESYFSSDMEVARDYRDAFGGVRPAKIKRPEVIGIDIDPNRFVDFSKPLNQQSEFVQKAFADARNRLLSPNNNGLSFFNLDGSLKETPALQSPLWNQYMDELYDTGVLGVFDKEGYAGDPDTYVFRHAEDVPKGFSTSKGFYNEVNPIPELSDMAYKITSPDGGERIKINPLEFNKVNEHDILQNLHINTPVALEDQYTKYAEQIVANSLTDKQIAKMNEQQINNMIRNVADEAMVTDFMKAHPEGVPIGNPKLPAVINNTKQLPKVQTNTKQLPKVQSKVKPTISPTTIATPKQAKVPLGARLYEAGLNPKKLVKIATDPEVLLSGMKTIEKIMTDPKAYMNVGKGLVRGILSPSNIGLTLSYGLVNKASEAVNKRLEDKYNIKSQAEFDKLYPTLSPYERGQLGYTYPEMHQTYLNLRNR